MKPGRELDALVAEKVMGLTNVYSACPECTGALTEGLFAPAYGCFKCGWSVPFSQNPVLAKPYSTDIAAAWLVVEKLVRFQLTAIGDGKNRTWSARSAFNDSVEADTAPHAICLAALKAIESKV